MHSGSDLWAHDQYSNRSLSIAAAFSDELHALLCFLKFRPSFAMHPCAPSAREVLQQQIASTAEFQQEFKRTTRAVQKSKNNGKRRDAGLRAKQTWILLRLIADQSSMNPHAVLAARRLLRGDIWEDAHTLVEQKV
jgi:hypothetical protein